MITVLAFEFRRALRRRLTILVPIVPIALAAYAAIAHWRGHAVQTLTPWMVILTASLLVFGQAILSDREGRFDTALRVAPVPRWFPIARRAFLLATPFALQFVLCKALFRLIGL